MNLFFVSLSLLFAVSVSRQQDRRHHSFPAAVQRKLVSFNSSSQFLKSHIVRKPSSDPGSASLLTINNEAIFDADGSLNPVALQLADEIMPVSPCQPRMATVPTPHDPDASYILMWPLCVDVKRCSGCCDANYDIFECAPTETSRVIREVMVLEYNPVTHDFDIQGIRNVSVEQHDSCRCQCRVQPEQCDPNKHWYDVINCQCRCLDEAARLNCPWYKRWDESLCRCVCPELTYCSDDEVYDFLTCRCVPRRM